MEGAGSTYLKNQMRYYYKYIKPFTHSKETVWMKGGKLGNYY